MKTLQYVGFLIFLGIGTCFGQKGQGIDSSYINCYRHLITLRPYFKIENMTFQVENREGTTRLDFVPNNNSQIGLAFNWTKVGIALGTNRPFTNRNLESKGETEALDIRSTVFARKWAADMYYLKYEGFYVNNTQDMWPDWEEGDYFKRPDLIARSFGFNAYYLFNGERYSMRAMYIQNEGQKKSAGSFVLKPSFRVLRIRSDREQLPQENQQSLRLTGELVHSKFRIIGVAPGYAHTLVWKGLYFNGSFLPGVTMQRHIVETREGDVQKNWRFNVNSKVA